MNFRENINSGKFFGEIWTNIASASLKPQKSFPQSAILRAVPLFAYTKTLLSASSFAKPEGENGKDIKIADNSFRALFH